MEKKMTNAVALNFVLENFAEMPDDVREKIQNIYNSTIKKSSSKKPSKNAEENKAFGEIIKGILADKEPMTITEIQNSNEDLKALSNQKVTAVVRMLIKAEEVVKIVDGKKSRFTLAE